jgi:uncharacterized membrane protein YbhN (UPF0104 family)
MTNDQLLLLFFGMPLAILGMGLRRALGPRGLLLMLLAAAATAIYGLLLQAGLQRLGHGLPLPGLAARGMIRGFGPFCLGISLIGALGGVMMRFRGQGSLAGGIPAAGQDSDGNPDREE